MAFLPNVIPSVEGELPLFDKVSAEIDRAERWVEETFVTADECSLCAASGPELAVTCGAIVALEALRLALPSLNVVLTPNGIGVVSNANVAPASTDRVNALIDSLRQRRDNNIDMLLRYLWREGAWRTAPKGAFWRSTLWHSLDISMEVPQSDGSAPGLSLDRARDLISRARDIEDEIASEWVSPELMGKMRRMVWPSPMGERPAPESRVIRTVRGQTLRALRGDGIDRHRMEDLVTFIRNAPADFPLWHCSSTSSLFEDVGFRNRRGSGGYFF